MGPTKLPVRGPRVGRGPIGDDHLVATGVLAPQRLQGVVASRAMDAEGSSLGGYPDPEPGLLAGLSPAGLVDVDRVGLADGLGDLGLDFFERVAVVADFGVQTGV